MNRLSLLGRTLLRCVAIAAVGLAPGACVSYQNYPQVEAKDPAVNDPNVPPSAEVMAVALERVTSRYPAPGEYVVNLPQGLQKRRAEEVLRRLNDPRARLVAPDTQSLPAFHVTRIWIRPGERASVEVLRPVFGVGTPGVTPEYQAVTVNLRRPAMAGYRVDSVRVWPIGGAVPPPLYGWPDLEARPESASAAPAQPSDQTPEPAPTQPGSDPAPQ